jgi:hypothetical protein
MKTITFFSLMVSVALIHALTVQNEHLKLAHKHLEIVESGADILRDQLADYSSQLLTLRSDRTYEDGVEDGMKNAQNIKYMQGYHAATRDQNIFAQEIEVASQPNKE